MTRLLAVPVRGPSAWVLWQLVGDSLSVRIGQLERDPSVHRDVVRELRSMEADLRLAAAQYRELVSEAAESAEQPRGGSGGGLESPSRWGTTGLVAETLGCSRRWVSQLIATGRVSATRVGREWRVDLDSVEDYMRGALSAA